MAKKAESTLKNMLLSLTLIAFVASLALALVNNVTKGPIEKVNQEKVANAIKKVLPEGVEYTINADTVSVTTDKGPANVMRYTAVDAEGNQFYGPEYQSSIKQYLSEKLMDSTSSTAELKRLCADMLNYGTEAQTYFGYKVNEPINVFEDQAIMDAIAANMTTELAATEDRVTVEGAQSATLRFALNLRYQVETTVQATISNATGPKLVVRNHSDGTVVDTLDTANVSDSKWNAVFMKVAAANMRTLYDFVMEDNGEAVTKTTTWSVAAYAEDIRATAPTSNLSKMLDAMLIYGDAAAAYLKPNN